MSRKIGADEFVAAWQAATSVDDAARATGLARAYVVQLAVRLRRGGIPLKKFCERPQRRESLSDQAAKVARAERVSLTEAGARLGISCEAVRQSYRRMWPDDPLPDGRCGDEPARRAAVEMAMAAPETTYAEIAGRIGFSPAYVHALLTRSGVRPHGPGIAKRAAVDAAVAAVRAGWSVADAAAEHDVSYGGLLKACRDRGVDLRSRRAPGRDGKSVVAADMVELDGATVAEAARAMRCSPAAVYWVLKRRREERR